jgi:DNA protecting protein DprA
VADLTDFIALSLLPSRLAARGRRASCRRPADVVLLRAVAQRIGGPDIAALRAQAAASRDRAVRAGLTPIAWSDAAYPAALAAIADPPFVMWTRGAVSALARPAVAIVGSRAASDYGLAVASRLASDLAGRGVAVVSGLARGIDAAAHRGALSAPGAVGSATSGGATIAVLGSGADVIYPPEHAGLAHEIEPAGLVLSELVPGTPPLKCFFPLRNRIIGGLSRAVVVVEAGEKAGRSSRRAAPRAGTRRAGGAWQRVERSKPRRARCGTAQDRGDRGRYPGGTARAIHRLGAVGAGRRRPGPGVSDAWRAGRS